MNYPLLQRMLNVTGPSGRAEGTMRSIGTRPSGGSTPRAPLSTGAYRVVVDTDLEDVAGNKIDQPFDIDVFDKVSEHLTTRTVDVACSVR